MTTTITVKKEDTIIPAHQIIMGEIFCFVHENGEASAHNFYMKVSDQQVVQLSTGIILPFTSSPKLDIRLYDAEITLYPKRLGREDFNRKVAK